MVRSMEVNVVRWWVGLAMLACSISLNAQKTRAGQLAFAKPGVSYPLTIHIYALRVRPDCSNGYCINVLYADVILNGRKLEMEGSTGIPEKPYKRTDLLGFGDMRARAFRKTSAVNLGDRYEILLANNHILDCVISGMSE